MVQNVISSFQQIFTKFDENFKDKNIEALKKTYLGVLLSIKLNGKTSKIKDEIKKLMNSNDLGTQQEIEKDNQKVKVALIDKGDNAYMLRLAKINLNQRSA